MKPLTWTADNTAHGRDLLEAAIRSRLPDNMERFYAWLEANVRVDAKVARETFGRCFDNYEPSRALRLYDAMMKGYDPLAQTIGLAIRFVIGIALLGAVLGAIVGGFVYFVRAVLGSP